MISKILLTGLATFFLSGSIISVTDDCREHTASRSAAVQTAGQITKAIQLDGTVFPLVELPSVEITGTRNTNGLVEAIVVDGQVYPSMRLNEVIVTPGA